jgi:hypothetical protein
MPKTALTSATGRGAARAYVNARRGAVDLCIAAFDAVVLEEILDVDAAYERAMQLDGGMSLSAPEDRPYKEPAVRPQGLPRQQLVGLDIYGPGTCLLIASYRRYEAVRAGSNAIPGKAKQPLVQSMKFPVRGPSEQQKAPSR